MEIFFRLLFGHFLADFTFQTNYLAYWKRHNFAGLLVHVAIHPICYIALCVPPLAGENYLMQTWTTLFGIAVPGWGAIAALTLLHFVEDWFRVTMVNKGWPDNTLFYLWDQVVHISLLWIFSPKMGQELLTVWAILGTLFVVVTHFATVTVWFIEKDINGREYPETEEKYILILERLAVWLAFFMPHPWWIFVLIFLLGTFGHHVWTRKIDFSWSSVLMGNFFAILCGAISRFGLGYHF
jgi:hypothetical protein